MKARSSGSKQDLHPWLVAWLMQPAGLVQTTPDADISRTKMEQAIELMTRFAERTGLTSDRPPRRYLWTDAFAVCNFLAIARRTGDASYVELGQRLVEQVHRVLGRYADGDPRRGWISGLDDVEGALHPTRGGLRIGKPLPERQQGEPLDEELEWERDGQYFHYLTKWMHALDQFARATGQARYNVWARELASSAYNAFSYSTAPGGPPRLAWKMSVDLSWPLISATGHHDPLDGFITCAELELTATELARTGDAPSLTQAQAGLSSMMEAAIWETSDPLGIGGLLADAARVAELVRHGAASTDLLRRLLESALVSLRYYSTRGDLRAPSDRRLAFRELGLAIGLSAVEIIAECESSRSSVDPTRALLQGLRPYVAVGSLIQSFWLDPSRRRSRNWSAHRDINDVMLATSLVPDGFLLLEGNSASEYS